MKKILLALSIVGLANTLTDAYAGDPAQPDDHPPPLTKKKLAVNTVLPTSPEEKELFFPPMVAEKYTLPNGLEVILHVDRRAPLVATNIWYHVGSKDEAKGKNGFAHLFEHVMFQGSRNVGEDMFFRYLENAGVSDRNGTTSNDRTNYFETLPANQLALALWLESDRMGFLLDHANQDTFVSQRKVVKEERNQNYEDRPYGLVWKFVAETMFPSEHPYHRLTIGTPEDLDAASFEDVKNFFKTYYLPNNATLVVAGNIDSLTVKPLVEKYFATLPKGSTPPVIIKPIPVKLDGEKRLTIEAKVQLPQLQMHWHTPPHFTQADADLDILQNILSSGKSSRLYKRLVYELQIAQEVYASQYSQQLGSIFSLNLTLKKGKSLDEALKVVEEELGKVLSSPIPEEEFERARMKILSQMIFSLESVSARANMLNEYNQKTGDPNYFAKDIDRYRKTTSKSVLDTAKLYLGKNRVLALVSPNQEAPIAGRLLTGK